MELLLYIFLMLVHGVLSAVLMLLTCDYMNKKFGEVGDAIVFYGCTLFAAAMVMPIFMLVVRHYH